MLWFILAEDRAPAVFVDGDRVYAVQEVIQTNLASLNTECDEEDDYEEEFINES
jgi:hypothetical protein